MSLPPIPLADTASAAPRRERPLLPAWAFVVMATLIGLNLRAALGSVPPLLGPITDDLGLNGTTQGMLTSVAILFTGLCAPLGQKLGARVGPEQATAIMLGTLGLGCLLRLVADHAWVFLLSSAVAGAGMGGATALMPSLIAHHVPRIRGIAMGLYSTGLAMGVAVAAWIAVPTERWLGGWQPALAVWGLVALLTMSAWIFLIPRLRGAHPDRPVPGLFVDHRLPWRSGTAWWVTWYTTACMVIGFSGLAWVTPLYVALGVAEQRAATYFVLFQVIQLVAMLTLPWITDFTRDRRPMLALVLGSSAVGVSCLLIDPLGLVIPAMCLFGLGAGGGSTLALVLLVDAADTQTDAARLSGMVMLIAYTTGALAPVMLGTLHDLTGGFGAGYAVVLVLIVLALVTVPVFHPRRRLESSSEPAPRRARQR